MTTALGIVPTDPSLGEILVTIVGGLMVVAVVGPLFVIQMLVLWGLFLVRGISRVGQTLYCLHQNCMLNIMWVHIKRDTHILPFSGPDGRTRAAREREKILGCPCSPGGGLLGIQRRQSRYRHRSTIISSPRHQIDSNFMEEVEVGGRGTLPH